MVSGDVGSGLPEPALFEATRRTMSVDLYDCFYLSNNPEHLDTAKELGMATGLFVTGNEAAPRPSTRSCAASRISSAAAALSLRTVTATA